MNLRPYQLTAIEAIRAEISKGNKRIILCSPTGSGKTVIFSHIVALAAAKGKKCLLVTDRIELLKQTGNALDRNDLLFSSIEAGKRADLNGQLFTAMVETIARRVKQEDYADLIASMDLIIFDEAHKQTFNKLFPYIAAKTTVIGATATPYRKGSQTSLDEFYQAIVETISIPELIDQGYLADCKSYGVPVDLSAVPKKAGEFDETAMGQMYTKNRVFDGVIENYQRICPGSKTLIFAPNIESSQVLCDALESAGINARHLDSTMTTEQRSDTLTWLKTQPDAVLCNVGILTTGFDEPSIETVVLYRATTSLPLFLQMVGRGSRITQTKKRFTLLDFGENVKRHGFWEDDRLWTLQKAPKPDGVPSSKDCPECKSLIRAQVSICPKCGHIFTPSEKEKQDRIKVELQELPKKEINRLALKASMDDQIIMVKAKVVKARYLMHQFTSIAYAREFATKLGWNFEGWYYVNRRDFPNLK
jgi:superfamily II DNA or RNA helicase